MKLCLCNSGQPEFQLKECAAECDQPPLGIEVTLSGGTNFLGNFEIDLLKCFLSAVELCEFGGVLGTEQRIHHWRNMGWCVALGLAQPEIGKNLEV